MIAAYILTRMAELLQARAQVDLVTKILAGATVLITIICVLVILTADARIGQIGPR